MSDTDQSPLTDIPMKSFTPAATINGPEAPVVPPHYPSLHQSLPPPMELPVGRGVQQKDDWEKDDDTDSIPKDGNINVDHLDLSFEECFHEHKSTRTFPKLYTLMGMVYQYTKLIFYHSLVLTLGLLLAFLWAIINGVMAFVHTWIYNPALKAILLWVYAITPIFTEPLRAFFKPLVDVSARIFRQIRVSTNFSGGVGWYSHTKTNQV